MSAGTLIGIARRAAPRAPMEMLMHAPVTRAAGVAGDCRGRAKPDGRIAKRQVTLLRREDWTVVEAALGCALPWTMRRANLLVEGLDLPRRAGTTIAIGEVRLRVTGECDPCARMDAEHRGLWRALVPDWRGGYLTTVVADGAVALGDRMTIDEMGTGT